MKAPVMDGDTKVQQVRSLVLTEGTAWDQSEREFCDDHCIERYLISTKGEVKGAAKSLVRTLKWRRDFRVAELRDANEFLSELRLGTLYVAGHNNKGQPIVVSRCRKEKPEAHMLAQILRCIVFGAECAVRALRNGHQQWITVIDMSGFTTAAQPPIKATAEIMRVLMDHYPERMQRLFIVDAPTVFWLFFKAVSPFVDPSTRDKIQFVYTKKLLAGTPLAPDTPEARFAADQCLSFYQARFDEKAYLAMMKDMDMLGPQMAAVQKQAPAHAEPKVAGALMAADEEAMKQLEPSRHLNPASTALVVAAN